MRTAARYHNFGEAGATSSEVAAGQLPRCLELHPDLVTVVCGANDVLLSVRPDIDAHAAALAHVHKDPRAPARGRPDDGHHAGQLAATSRCARAPASA